MDLDKSVNSNSFLNDLSKLQQNLANTQSQVEGFLDSYNDYILRLPEDERWDLDFLYEADIYLFIIKERLDGKIQCTKEAIKEGEQ